MKAEYIGYALLAIAALRYLYRLGKKDEYKPSKMFEQSEQLQQNGSHRKAIEILTESIKYHGYDFSLYFSRGNAHLALGEHSSAIEDYTSAIALFSEEKNSKLYYINRDKATKQLNEYRMAKSNRQKAQNSVRRN
jgi:tetratricopeptide (TPR) repeat protein